MPTSQSVARQVAAHARNQRDLGVLAIERLLGVERELERGTYARRTENLFRARLPGAGAGWHAGQCEGDGEDGFAHGGLLSKVGGCVRVNVR